MKSPITRRKFLKYGIYSGIVCLAASYPFFIERYLVQINVYNIPVRNLPGEFNDFKILQLTDLHYCRLTPEIFIERLINKANSLKKDLIVCTGDYVLSEKKNSPQVEIVWSMLEKLKAEYGVYSILGNHDHSFNFNKSIECLNKSGQNIRHKSISINKNGSKIWLGGAGDLWTDDIGIDKAFENVPDRECKILLAHNPDTADCEFKTRVDLMISGHTHGGQVNFPLIGPLILPVKNRRYSNGFIRSQHTDIFISKGIGWAIFPVRFNCCPEIAILNLRKA